MLEYMYEELMTKNHRTSCACTYKSRMFNAQKCDCDTDKRIFPKRFFPNSFSDKGSNRGMQTCPTQRWGARRLHSRCCTNCACACVQNQCLRCVVPADSNDCCLCPYCLHTVPIYPCALPVHKNYNLRSTKYCGRCDLLSDSQYFWLCPYLLTLCPYVFPMPVRKIYALCVRHAKVTWSLSDEDQMGFGAARMEVGTSLFERRVGGQWSCDPGLPAVE